MLNVTEAAIAWLLENRAGHHVPAEYGVRIFQRPAGEGVAVHSAPRPEEDELTVTRHGIRFFVTRVLVESLNGRVIDAASRSTGSGLVIRRQRPTEQRLDSEAPTGNRSTGLRGPTQPARQGS